MKKKPILSFEEEDESEAPELEFKFKKNVKSTINIQDISSTNLTETPSQYSHEQITKLKQSQLSLKNFKHQNKHNINPHARVIDSDTIIPTLSNSFETMIMEEDLNVQIEDMDMILDEAQINAIKQRRSKAAQKELNQNDIHVSSSDFIPLNSNQLVSVSQTESSLSTQGQYKSRLVTEDEFEEFEEFNDYKTDSLIFGANAAVKAQEIQDLQYKTDFKKAQLDIDNQELNSHWEQSQIKKGVSSTKYNEKQPIEEVHLDIFQTISSLSTPLPSLITSSKLFDFNSSVPSSSKTTPLLSIISKVSSHLSSVEFEFNNSSRIYSQADKTNLESLKYCSVLESDLNLLALKNSFYTELKQWADGYSEFLDEKTNSLNENENQSCSEQDNNENEILQSLFNDAKKEFSSLPIVFDRFLNWKIKYPKDFYQTYSHLIFPQVFDIFLRVSMVKFDFEKNFIRLKMLNWYSALESFPHLIESDKDIHVNVLLSCLEKSFFPRLKNKITLIELESSLQTNNLIHTYSDIASLFEIESKPMKSLVKSIEVLVSESITRFLSKFKTNPNHHNLQLILKNVVLIETKIPCFIEPFISLLKKHSNSQSKDITK